MVRKGRRSGTRRAQNLAGNMTLQYSLCDNVAEYTTINITTASLRLPTDQPVRIRWVRFEFSCSPDASVSSKSHVPLLQLNVMAPSGTSTPRIIARTRPRLVPSGRINVQYIRVPNAGFFVYDSAQTVVCQAIVSASANLAVTANIFCNFDLEFPSYQGLSLSGFEPVSTVVVSK